MVRARWYVDCCASPHPGDVARSSMRILERSRPRGTGIPRSGGCEHLDGLRGGRAAETNVVGAHCFEVSAEGERRRQMDGVEGPELGRLQRGRRLHHILVEVDKGNPRKDGPRSPDRAAADPSRHPLHLDASHHARHPLRPRLEELPKRLRLDFGDDELHDGGGVEAEELPRHRLRAIFAELPEGVCALGGDRPLRRGEVEKVALRSCRPPRRNQLSEGRTRLVDRTEDRYRLAALGHLEALAALHPAQVPGEVLAELSYAHSVGGHVYTHCSIVCQTFAPLSRSPAISENLR